MLESILRQQKMEAEIREMARLARAGLTYREIGCLYGIKKAAVGKRFAKAGIRRRPLDYQRIDKKQLIRLYIKERLTLSEIARTLKTGEGTINRALEFHGIGRRPALKLGGIRADFLRTLKIGQSARTQIVAAKNLQAGLHSSARNLGIKISVRSSGDGWFRVVRIS